MTPHPHHYLVLSVSLFSFSCSSRYVVVSHGSFNLVIPNDYAEHVLMCLFATHISSLVKCVFGTFGKLDIGLLFFYCSAFRVIYMVCIQVFVRNMICKYFLPVRGLLLNSLISVFCKARIFNFNKVQIIMFLSWIMLLWLVLSVSRNSLPNVGSCRFSHVFLLEVL